MFSCKSLCRSLYKMAMSQCRGASVFLSIVCAPSVNAGSASRPLRGTQTGSSHTCTALKTAAFVPSPANSSARRRNNGSDGGTASHNATGHVLPSVYITCIIVVLV